MPSDPISNARKLEEYQRLVERDGEVCQWCGRGPTQAAPLTIDHIDPEGGDDLDNKQLLCAPCNGQKGNSTDDKTVRWQSALWQRGFTMIPNVVLDSNALSVYAFRVYSLLVYYARQDDSCWPGQEGLAQKAKCSDRQIRESLRELERAGLVRTRRRGRGQTNVYILLVPRAARGSDLGAREEPGSDPDRQEVPGNKTQTKKKSSPSIGRIPRFQVLGERVTDEEYEKARAILLVFNEVAGTSFSGIEWVKKIVRRLREHNDVSLEQHEQIIRSQFERPWWRGDPSPSVIYGNGQVFDRALHGVRGPKPPEREYDPD